MYKFIKIVILLNIFNLGYSIGSPIFWNENNDITETFNTVENGLNYRLPNHTIPIQYNIILETDIHKGNLSFTGEVEIILKVVNNTNSIVVHNRQLTINNVILTNLNDPKTIYPVNHVYNSTLEFSIINLTNINQVLKIGENYNLKIQYNGTLRSDNGGFYKSEYKNNKNETRYLATTQFESTDARHGFPCYDEPAIKANFNITILHDSSYSAISNMPVEKTYKAGNRNITNFKITPKMSTYLVAFIISDFEYTFKSSSNNFEQRVYSRPETKSIQQFALDSGISILSGIEKYLNVKYSLPKMDQVAVPDFAAGAMENWGLVTYREELLLFDNNKSTINTKTGIATTVAHEYGHQWFGNLVSPKWWTYIWLNEGFASLFAYIGSDIAYPEWNLMEYFMVAEYQRALSADAGKNPRPMTHYVQKPKEIVGLFDTVSYSKASCVIRMMQHVLTEDNFKKSLTKYLLKNQYNSTVEEDLFDAFQITAKAENFTLPVEIKVFMGTWTHQGGYPLVTVTRNYKDGTFNISQIGFTNAVTTENNNDTRLWWVPFNYATGTKSNFESTIPDGYLKAEKSIIFTPNENVTEKDWLIINKQSTGYYRVNYDDNNWNLITEALKKNHTNIHTNNRAQLVNDAFRLSITKHININILFNLLTYLENEDSYSVWSTANAALSYFNEFLRADDEYKLYQFYVQKIVKNIFEKLGITDDAKDKHFDKYTRNMVVNWACISGNKKCLENTNKKLVDFVENGKLIEPNLQSVIYCNGLKQAKEKEFNHLYELLLNSNDQAERQLLMSSLGCSQNKALLSKFVASSINTETVNLRPQERISVLKSVYSKSDIGFHATIEFLYTKFNEYAELTPGFSQTNPLNDAISGLSTYVINETQKKTLEKLLEKVKNHPKLDKNLPEIVQANMKNNLDWIKDNRKAVFEWMATYEKANRNVGNYLTISFITIIISIITSFVI